MAFHQLAAKAINGATVNFSKYAGRVVLVENVARDYTQMNELADKYASKPFSILCFPCNQFGHQECPTEEEIPNALKYCRPGNGFEPKGEMFAKVHVNGAQEDPVFTLLKNAVPAPTNDFVQTAEKLIWSPIRRNDIRWNFEKFLVGKDGTVLKRYDAAFATIDIAPDIEAALNA